MYYEIHGKGTPLVLLHGGFMDIPSWGETLTTLAQSRQVIAFDMEGHGRTADLDRPLTWEQIADDVAAAVKTLGGDKASGGMDGPLRSQLAVLPNTTHLSIFTRSDLLVPIVNPFLDAPMPV